RKCRSVSLRRRMLEAVPLNNSSLWKPSNNRIETRRGRRTRSAARIFAPPRSPRFGLSLAPHPTTASVLAMKFAIAFLFSLGLLGSLLAASSKVPSISHDELTKAIAAKTVTIIDVNGSDSFSEGRIPGAIDYFAHKDALAAVLPKKKDALVVAYCG